MNRIHRQILINQTEIMNALDYLLMPEKPRQKEYQRNVARRDMLICRKESGKLIEQDNIKRNKGNTALKAERKRKC